MQKITEQLLEENFPTYLIKVADQKEYIDDLLAGHLYMKESGFFRGLEDTYRGDIFDGRKPMDVSGHTIELRSEDGESLIFNDSEFNIVKNFHMGFVGDDKVPIFCACMLNTDLLEITGEYTFRVKREYIEELSKFGKYVAVIPIGEMIDKLNKFNKQHKKMGIMYGAIEYTDIMHAYSLNEDFENDVVGQYRCFFRKDLSYRCQNEWRILAVGEQPLIGENEDHMILNVGKFEYALSLEMDMLINGEFSIDGE